jgi:TRAP-type C4-dicarboxylate transport system permease small subunit
MTTFLKILRILLILILGFILIVTSIFIFDRYVSNPHMKGISPVDIKHICIYLVSPLLIMIFGIRFIEKKRRKASSQQRV